MRIDIVAEAKEDLISGFHFYEAQSPGLGSYFLDSVFSDIDSLLLYAGLHRVVCGSHRLLARRFPFAIYYRIESETIRVRAVLDCRQHPSSTWQRLQGG
jgi:plasmid stabilization system protein ParE